jgi:hypothetical protein
VPGCSISVGGAATPTSSAASVDAAFIMVMFAVFFGRLFQLQVIQTDDLRLRSPTTPCARCASRRRAATSSIATDASSPRRARRSACS